MAPAHAIDGPDAHDHATKQLAPELTIDGPQQDGYSINGGLMTTLSGGANLIDCVFELQPQGVSHDMGFKTGKL